MGPRRRNAGLLGEGVFDGLELVDLLGHALPRRPPSAPTPPGVRISGEEGKRGTVGVNKIEDIRRRARAGEPVASIARHVGVSEPTVRKRARMADLSPEPPSVRRLESEVLAPSEGTIDSQIDNDGSNWRKQHWLDGFKAYLSAAVDCFDGWPVCWRVSLHPDAGLALGTLGDLVAAVRPTEGRPLVLHTDGGAVSMTDEWAAACAAGHAARSRNVRGAEDHLVLSACIRK